MSGFKRAERKAYVNTSSPQRCGGPAGPTLLQNRAFYLQKSPQGFLLCQVWSSRGSEDSRGSNSLGPLEGQRNVQQIVIVLLVSLIPECRTYMKKYFVSVVTLRFTFFAISSFSELSFQLVGVCVSCEIILLRHTNLLVFAIQGIIRKVATWENVHNSS